jgi:hypothetical protein
MAGDQGNSTIVGDDGPADLIWMSEGRRRCVNLSKKSPHNTGIEGIL